MVKGSNQTGRIFPEDLQIVPDNMEIQQGSSVILTTLSRIFPSAKMKIRNGPLDLSGYQNIAVTYRNIGEYPALVSSWVVSDGWGGSAVFEDNREVDIRLEPGETKVQRVSLHAVYPDGYQQVIDPAAVSAIHTVIRSRAPVGTRIEVQEIRAEGKYSGSRTFPVRYVAPVMKKGEPGPGKRVQIGDDSLYHALYLPENWVPGKKFPVIAEFGGNICYGDFCYSTGRPEDDLMGYGISKGRDYIWLSLPFVTREGEIAENGWGDLKQTREYTIRSVREALKKWGGDPAGVFITGFSRGAIAAGYLGLMDDEMADIWLGFHSTQHTDGSWWNGAETGVEERGARVRGRACLITDNDNFPWNKLMPALGNPLTALHSGISCHTPANTMDERESSQAERRWYRETYQKKPGTCSIRGTITDAQGNPLAGISVETGLTHFCRTDAEGRYLLEGLVKGERRIHLLQNGNLLHTEIVRGNLLENTEINFNIQIKKQHRTY